MTAARNRLPGNQDGARAIDNPEPSDSKQALLYLRVSTARQAEKGGEAEGYSIPAQRAACTRKVLELGAEVVDEFVDAGESARSIDRPALQSMLQRLKKGGVDYVIVHKLDRLARDLADDVAIGLAIQKAGAILVSVSEPIDGSPTGVLVHGIMASLAQFYSLNLGLEAKKGLHEKARRGGTPAYAPLGYLNSRKQVEGVEIKTVVPDPDRSLHIRWAFTTYAAGQWSLADLTDELEHRGLKTRPTRTYVGSPISRSAVHRMLTNPYYTGKIRYGGVIYDGKHEPLVDEATFQSVQDVLSGRRLAGDRSWKHLQYLKGTVFCDRCGQRFSYGHSTGRHGGEYPYFFCLGRHRKRTDCDLPYLVADKVEAAVSRVWGTVTFSTELVELVTEAVHQEFDERFSKDMSLVASQRRRLVTLDHQKQKLIDAYLAEALSLEDLKLRQATVQAELVAARQLIERATNSCDLARHHVDRSLELLRQAGELYRCCPPEARQTLNQALFDGLFVNVGHDGEVVVASIRLKPEFEALIRFTEQLAKKVDHRGLVAKLLRGWHLPPRRPFCPSPRIRPAAWREEHGPRVGRASAVEALVLAQDSNVDHLAEREGFEPSDPG